MAKRGRVETRAAKPKGKVSSAVGAASKSDVPGLGEKVEMAMSEAVAKACADGITEPDEVKARMMAAREKALRG